MTSLRRFTHGIAPFVLLASCAELIGLSDYETGEASDDGAGGEGETGGRGGSGATGGSGGSAQGGSGGMGAKPGVGGEDDGGDGGKGGTISRGGTTSDAGMGGETDGGEGGKGGTGPTGGMAGGGKGGMSGAGGAANGGGGGSGGSPVCTEITISTYIGPYLDSAMVPAVAAYFFEVEPELGQNFDDTLEIQFWDDGGSGSYDGALTGSFMLGPPGPDSNFAFCSRCVVVTEDSETTRERTFFQTEGTITLPNTSDQMTGFGSWTLTDVTLREVTIDADQISTVVPGGACLHIESATYEAPSNWVCDIAWYSDADCDCGCGQLDPTCSTGSATLCDYCWCDDVQGYCSTGEVVASSNWLCN